MNLDKMLGIIQNDKCSTKMRGSMICVIWCNFTSKTTSKKTGPWAIFFVNFNVKNGALIVNFFKRFFLRQILITEMNLNPKFHGNRSKTQE